MRAGGVWEVGLQSQEWAAGRGKGGEQISPFGSSVWDELLTKPQSKETSYVFLKEWPQVTSWVGE